MASSLTATPQRYTLTWAKNATSTYIRSIPETTVDVGRASLDKGFPSETFLPLTGGGIACDGRDFNGINNSITANLQWIQGGMKPVYNTDFSTAIGGYPAGAILHNAPDVIKGCRIYYNKLDGNTDNPEVSLTNYHVISPRIKLQADLTLYVSTTGVNTGVTGTDPLHPLDSIALAREIMLQNYDINGYKVIVQLADGTYMSDFNCYGTPVGYQGLDYFTVRGNISNPANVKIITTEKTAIRNYSHLKLEHLELGTIISGSCVLTNSNGITIIGDGVIFGACAESHIICNIGGKVYSQGSYTISGNALYHYYCPSTGGTIDHSSAMVTLTGTPVFTAFAKAENSTILFRAANFTGSATGKRYEATLMSLIFTSGGTLPGSTGGTVDASSLYT